METTRPTKNFWQQNALTLVCLGLFVLFLIAQSITGWRAFNADQVTHHQPPTCFTCYLSSGEFFEATLENWESEFLQMGAFVLLTVFLIQKGSPESKQMKDDPRDEDPRKHKDDPNAPWPVRKGGLWLKLYENSLFIAFVVLFLLSIIGHAIGGAHAYSAEQLEHGEEAVTTLQFIQTSEFWFQSFQNWQSEFLAVATIAFLGIYLRQKGSAESKPVFQPHTKTGDE